MANPLFPLFLQLTERPCLLIGGGNVATEKANRLIHAGAQLTIVAPQVVAPLQQLILKERVDWIADSFQERHLQGMWFAVSTLQDPEVNRKIYEEANRLRIFLNVVDRPNYCTCHWPAIVDRAPVTVAFSTAGNAPALAGYLRQTINHALPHRLGELASWLSHWRSQVQPFLPDLDARALFWRQLFTQGLVEQFAAGEQERAEQMILKAIQKLTPPLQEQEHD
ncbi:precorrin-2 dehydrogenase/sirohydrochlorin ferrochelatase family protein [Candidatus Magnetaquicoccus inordinatus]|uniref:precorrin-2 dehydrogenase/sirohydrochlorin ferrochelatase family protein n=1 Tax=Candidatus Magnetaquicoccus inordinatus TaxID=2496818 RepID=UPI00102C7C67|nr:bifunctional precorrin-2 dehydrogenase/sirohydrochlorin ferrochelatase [Candidatus Magnetaquicoccus inordinatus]